jgi:hypothetical protein
MYAKAAPFFPHGKLMAEKCLSAGGGLGHARSDERRQMASKMGISQL